MKKGTGKTPNILLRTFFLIVFVMTLLAGSLVKAQVIIEAGDIFDEVVEITNDMPGIEGGEYEDPTEEQLSQWNDVLTFLFDKDYDAAAQVALGLDYELVEFTDDQGDVYFMLRNAGANYWGTYIFNPYYCNRLVIQVPHPVFDFRTNKEGIHVFREIKAMFFQMSGAHRCNRVEASSCDGLTSSCNVVPDQGPLVPHKISDMAHTTTSIFQATTGKLFSHFSDSYFISLHAFGKKASDPYVILSNGTRVTPAVDYIDILADELKAIDPVLTFKIPHQDLMWDRLMGFTNTQGRLINSSVDICEDDATLTDGRFIHMEQEKMRLRNDINGWNKVANALFNTFGCYEGTINPYLLPFLLPPNYQYKYGNAAGGGYVECGWSANFGTEIDYYEIQHSADGTNWEIVGSISPEASPTGGATNFILNDTNPFSRITYYRLKQVNTDGNFAYSAISKVKIPSGNNTDGGTASMMVFNAGVAQINIAESSEKITYFKVFNMLNQDLSAYVKSVGQQNAGHVIDVAGLPAGCYVLVTNIGAYKFIKQP